MIFFKILLTIILIPLKIVFFVLAYIFYMIMYILHCILMVLLLLIGVIGSFTTMFFGFGSILVTIYTINQICSGEVSVVNGVFLIIVGWVLAILPMVSGGIIDFLAEGALTLGEIVTDFAKENWFGFW